MLNQADLDNAAKVISQSLYNREGPLTRQNITSEIERFRPVYNFAPEDIEYLQNLLETKYVTTMGVGDSLVDTNEEHDEDWPKYHVVRSTYWNDYEQYLLNRNWPPRVVSSINSVTNRILGLLNDPVKEGDWERRGLVIGHVQSGKTANYIGLITKAADYGYKFIIVIAGIHNNLRTQTQERIDDGFIGRDSGTKEFIGVGIHRAQGKFPVTVTTTESDFNKSLARRFGMELTSLNNTFILVIKKNASTLSSLYTWLKELNTREDVEKITDIPMLLIDDEADNASINTNRPELNPTRINREIRSILNLFRKRCYVGYTATPFANIFINPDSYDAMLGNDLFPEHFIHSLDAPTNYFGSERIFLDEATTNYFVREIEDAEEWLPLRHTIDSSVDDMPETLRKAINAFILSRAIRNLRGQGKSHCSMLVNVTRFVAVQREVKHLIEAHIEELQKAVRFNYKLPAHQALQNAFMADLNSVFAEEYSATGMQWDFVQEELNNAASVIKVFVVNSKSDEGLDYRGYEKSGSALTAIVVGGLSLSRGLTIEGLTISYMYRNSIMYDTLLQMGRWFGYRDGYEDLCRIYMSATSRGWYTHIAEATEELRMQIKRMRREGKKPSDFGLYVRSHPDSLIVTAFNKMRYTETRPLQVSYTGSLVETHILPASETKNQKNRELLLTFFDELQAVSTASRDDAKAILFRDIGWSRIQDFVLRYRFHEYMSDIQQILPSFIKETADLYPLWDVSFQSLQNQPSAQGFMIAAQERSIGKPTESEPGWRVGNKQRFSGNNNFEIGLSSDQKKEALDSAQKADRKKPIYADYTNARGKPLLIVHLLTLIDKAKSNEHLLDFAPAFSVSFPHSTKLKTVEYVVNQVWLKQFESERFDSADEEDDYDPDA